MKKLLALVCVGLVFGLMSGCGVNDPASAPRVTIDAIGTIDVGTYKNVTGKVEADTNISSISYDIVTATDAAVPPEQIAVEGPSKNNAKKLEFTATSPIKITVTKSASKGNYKLKISVTAGPSTTVTFPFEVTGSAGTPVTETTVTLGSYDNATVGSSIDLDAATLAPVLAPDAIKANSGVDIVGTYSAKFTALRIFNPVYAKDESNIDAFKTWASPAATSFVQITETQYAGISNAEQIKPLYDAGTTVTSASITSENAGKVGFVVKTDQDKYVAIKIDSFVSDAKSTWSIKASK